MATFTCLLLAIFSLCFVNIYCSETDLLVLTVATHTNDALLRFKRSAKLFNFQVGVLGFGEEWKGGEVATSSGGGQKINILKKALGLLPKDQLVLFIDSYDVVFTGEKEKLLAAYKDIGTRVLFSSEAYCWPDKSLEDKYPKVTENELRFLNSGGFMGPAGDLLEIVNYREIKDSDDDQLYYTTIYLDEGLRKRFDIKLDTHSKIFQTLNGALAYVNIMYKDGTGYLYNVKSKSTPIVIHGNGPIKTEFNSMTNYLSKSWTPTEACIHCNESQLDLTGMEPYEMPVVHMSIFVSQPTPFLDVFFKRIKGLTYPKSRIVLSLFVNESAKFQEHLIDDFKNETGDKYMALKELKATTELAARNEAMELCVSSVECEYLFLVDGIAQLTYPKTLQHLVTANRNYIVPLLRRRDKLWSNFWGALSKNGYYARSDDYVDIVEGTQVGLWNVPFTADAYMLTRWAAQELRDSFLDSDLDVDMAISAAARQKNIFMMLDNRVDFGYLIYPDTYTTKHKHNDLWQIFDNPLDWEEQYIHENYSIAASPDVKFTEIAQPCPDVYWFPLTTKKFAKEIIEEMEFFGQWSDGSSKDSRLEGGYENVPTRDIHMRQVEWEEHWIHVLRKYVHPIQTKVFQGYDDQPWARMNFVVRYKPDEQPLLRPHHDASSYTLNLALNERGVDYQGGGARFIRYDCSVPDTRVGWTLMHPGRVTHIHEGLPTTNGTRYIFVTFVNP